MNAQQLTAAELTQALDDACDPEQGEFLQRFFKTGPGEHAEGDLFRGIRVPVLRKLARKHRRLALDQVLVLLQSRYHEDRLLARLEDERKSYALWYVSFRQSPNDSEDLIHKAVGWMLREVGKRDLATEDNFLRAHYRNMPRTMLRYAIENYPEPKRQAYLRGKV